jgi:hypothetical protein
MASVQQMASKAISPGVFRRPGQSKQSFKLVLDGAVGTTALAEPVPVVQSRLPSAGTASTGYISTDNYTCARIMFGGTDAANETINYQVVLWYPVVPISGADEMTYTPLVVAAGVATLGTAAYTTDDMGAATNLFADTITNTRTVTGVAVNSPAGNSKAWLDIDLHNASGIEIQTERGTAASADVFLQLGEAPVPFDLTNTVSGVKTTVEAIDTLTKAGGDGDLADILTKLWYTGWRYVGKSSMTTGGNLFEIIGLVEVKVYGRALQDVTGAGNCSVGTPSSPALLIPSTLNTDIHALDLWISAAPAPSVDASDWKTALINGSVDNNIILTGTWTSGHVVFGCFWKPLLPTSRVISA